VLTSPAPQPLHLELSEAFVGPEATRRPGESERKQYNRQPFSGEISS